MSVKDVLHEYQRAEDRGEIASGLAHRATFCTILESGLVHFHRAYFGDKNFAEARKELSASAAQHNGEQTMGALQESLLSDISRVNRTLRETHTTTDFPAILANLRARVLRDNFSPVDSDIQKMAKTRPVSDFKPIRGLRADTFGRLPIRPERTDVKRTTFGTTEDFYAIANYELAFDYTWEMWVNDDIGVFTRGLEELGNAARRSRALVIYDAISDALTRTVIGGGVGGPTIDRLVAANENIAARKDAKNRLRGLSMTDITYGAKWKGLANSAMNSEKRTPTADGDGNPAYHIAAPHEDAMMAEVLGDDWLAYDNRSAWLEFAVLAPFQAGPMTYTQLPDVREHIDQGSFDNHTFCVKVGDAIGAKVVDDSRVLRVKGS